MAESPKNAHQQSLQAFARLLEIMVQLRDPQKGCPWDREQNFLSILPYTLEEAYEVADAIERHDVEALKEELGDLLFQVIFHARMASEQSAFDIGDVIEALNDKMTRRHPHVFGEVSVANAAEQTHAWEDAKARERGEAGTSSVLDDVPQALPSLLRAQKLQKRAARIGFDWPEAMPVLDKVAEELDELKEALSKDADPDHVAEEIGDLLFATVNLCRHLNVDAEMALRYGNQKFERRFRDVEEIAKARGLDIGHLSLEKLDRLWREVKAKENDEISASVQNPDG